MCMRLRDKRVFFANKSIVVFKRMNPTARLTTFISPYRDKKYVSGKEYSSDFSIYEKDVYKGIHAYRHIRAARQAQREGAAGSVIVKCVIPAGANYFIGTHGEIVSNNLHIGKVVVNQYGKGVKENA